MTNAKSRPIKKKYIYICAVFFFLKTKDSKLLWLQFRINHNNNKKKKILFKIGISSTNTVPSGKLI